MRAILELNQSEIIDLALLLEYYAEKLVKYANLIDLILELRDTPELL